MASSELLAAGPAIVRTIELAADLTLLTARVAGREDLADRARTLRDHATPLAAEDAAAYSELLDTNSDTARAQTVELPLRMAELAADTAEIAADAAEHVQGAVASDAAVGALLAETAARAAALLVRVNGGGDAGANPAARAARAAARVG